MSQQEKSAEPSALQRAALLVEKMQSRLDAVERARTEPIAVVGMGCRFPGGAVDGPSFWKVLRDGVDALRETPESRWDVPGHFDETRGLPGKMYGTRGGFLDDVENFDAEFFGISPREAASLDPQQRLVLEVAWEALENAGLAPHQLAGSKTGVFMGVMSSDYMARLLKENDATRFDGYMATGNGYSFVPGRVSYVLGLQGPAMPVDTACSSSLVALHLASESLRRGESNLALAGGVNLILSPETTICLCSMQALASDGRCKTFDAAADGYVRGEGCGVLVLKRLSDAQRDGDSILALIRGSAVNHDGASGGLTVPNGPSQQAVVQRALDNARIAPALVGYVEAHGTGTPLGDPIELRALGAVLGKGRPEDRPFFIGSVKTNIGHLEPAAGIAGVIKTILSLQHQEIPPHLHFRTPNPHVEWDRIPARVPVERVPWPAHEGRRIAGVSSFGLSGINAHVVLEEAPSATVPAASDEEAQARLVVLSAKTPGALSSLAERWSVFLKGEEPGSLADISATSTLGRTHHEHRLALAAKSREELLAQLAAFAAGESHAGLSVGRRGSGAGQRIVFVFPGQGSQWLGMGQQLYARDATFREAIDRCHEALGRHVDWSLRELLTKPGQQSRWNDIDVIQPTLFALQVALAAVWRSWGLEPHAVVGHSMGEVAAAHVAGVLSLEDAARIICERSKLLRRVSGKGAMAVVDLSREQAEAEIRGAEDRIAIAVSNGPKATVLSGDPAALKEVMERLERREVFCRWVKVDVASHSPQMDPLRQELLERMAAVRPTGGTVPLYSTVTGAPIEGQELNASYWVRNLRQPVLFADAVQRLIQDGNVLFIELSPHPILVPFVDAMLREGDTSGRGLVVPSLLREQEEWPCLLSSLGAISARVDRVDWLRLHPEKRRRVALPSYPWQRERHWLELKPAISRGRVARVGGHPLLGASFTTSVQTESRFWESTLSAREPSFLADHRVGGQCVVPGAAYLEMALSAARELTGGTAHELVDTSFKEGLLLPEGHERTVQLALSGEREGVLSFQLSSQKAGTEASAPAGWMAHVVGHLRPMVEALSVPTPESFEAIRARCPEVMESAAHYEALARGGVAYGPAFQGVRQVWRGRGEALGHVRLPEPLVARASAYRIHPALLDACFQLVAAAVPQEDLAQDAGPAVPVALANLRLHEQPGTEVFCHVRLRPLEGARGGVYTFDLELRDASGRLQVEALGLRVQQLDMPVAEGTGRDLFFAQEWRHAPAVEPVPASGTEAGGRWLLIADGSELSDTVESLLRERQGEVLRVDIAGAGPGRRVVDTASPQAFDAVLSEAFGAGSQPRGVIHLTGQEPREVDPLMGCGGVLHLVQALGRAGLSSPPRLWLVTRGVHHGSDGRSASDVLQAPLWGLGRTLAHEHSELKCTRVDVSAALGSGDAGVALVRELLVADAEEEISLRADGRHVARIVRGVPGRPVGEAVVPAEGHPFLLERDARGRLERRANTRRPPEAGELEIEVSVASHGGLESEPWEAEGGVIGCSGRVVAVGEGVKDVVLGEERVALVASRLGSHVCVPVVCTALRPSSSSHEDAAALAAAVLPAWYALFHLGRLEKRGRVLILGTSSGLGRAAVKLARWVGAEVFAVATTTEQRASLRELGADHVVDPGEETFVTRLLAATGGSGVELAVVAPGAVGLDRSLAVLGEGARVFDLRTSSVPAPVGDANIAWCGVDVPAFARRRPERFARLWQEVKDAFEVRGLPSVASGVNSFTLNHPKARVVVPSVGAKRLRADGTYLVTGGLGGLGFAVAKWMVEQGAGHLVLIGRDTALTPEQQQDVAALEAAGARVRVARADVSDRAQLARVLSETVRDEAPLRGVIHAAGVLDDGVLSQQTVERFQRVMAPKVRGGWNLHVLTREAPLDFFVLYSSAASLFGAPGQGNYVAANAFLDALAHHRRALGLPGLSINWGPFSEVGLAAAQANRGERLAQRGSDSLTPAEGHAILGRLLDGEVTQMAVMPLELRKWVEFYPRARSSPWLSELVPAGSGAEAREPGNEALLETLKTASPKEARAALEQFVREQLARVLRLDSARIAPDAPLQGFGLDSLMGLELRNRLAAGLALSLPASLIWKHPTLEALCAHLQSEVMDRNLAETLARADEGTRPVMDAAAADDNEVFVL
ncbi:SDR family NAD(P)-dependent oxidoreductase [Myxococcus llanfairpwllgwyngyllgogerychwyrndrobwllllantysiliogogogochensis]|uniref:SDR family NAD(P)-dependent oxidoreductase n=1 Tax=Myxococcus llanfairpwllgwyngyllgogerychwyrndrobwllllantysiliogogogochensis TaxID=2590453 RepID=A0A540X633_9BACT|nr:type I polyketide synthase [Myxococcus llanfairpwllgwyngyllgogerychwyrndrobwllllantysiliogogogochensis]TQF16693.1 SDR family NAD(P)-dependent oxidoreductase [Myxococcus llanfairpwllgwyngyllgogerychwyrndrobwllllantysiliogogogochensis]